MRVNYDDPLVGEGELDINGKIRMYYNSQPFTGILEYYENQVLIHEIEYENGFEWGLYNEYYPDGSPRAEGVVGKGGYRLLRKWDEEGILTYHKTKPEE